MAPSISIVLPFRDAEATLGAAIASMLDQSYRDFELICVDNGSVDRSRALIVEVRRRDRRVRLVREPRHGIVPALNCGLAEARADLVARMDADDVSLPERLRCQFDFLSAHPEIDVLGTAVTLMDQDGAEQVIGLPSEPDLIRHNLVTLDRPWVLAHPTVMMRRRACEAVGGYRELFRHAEDYDLWLRLSERGRITNLDEPLLHYSTRNRDSRPLDYRIEQIFAITAARWCACRRRDGGIDPLDGFVGSLDDDAAERIAGGSVIEFWLDHLFLIIANRFSDAERADRVATVLRRIRACPATRQDADYRDYALALPWSDETWRRLAIALNALPTNLREIAPEWFRIAAARMLEAST